MTETQVELDIQDFTRSKPRILFRIDDDVFECVPALPVLSLIDFATMAEKVGEDVLASEAREMFVAMFDLVLTDSSALRFTERLSSKSEPISMEQATDIVPYVMEKYGMRPPMPSDSSSTGFATPGSGLISTATAAPEASTSQLSPSPVSST